MRYLSLLLISFIVFSCSKPEPKEETTTTSAEVLKRVNKDSIEQAQKARKQAVERVKSQYTKPDSIIFKTVQKLDKEFISTPFYVDIDSGKYFINSTEKLSYNINWFNGLVKYGISNDSMQLILDTVYDKIINPNLTLKNCFEIKAGSKYGLFNYKTGEVLKPQFEVIFPSDAQDKTVAYGLQNHQWYGIDYSNITKPYLYAFNPEQSLKKLSFDVDKLGQSIMYDSYWREYEDEPNAGRGVVLIPSYLSYLDIIKHDYTDVILAHQANDVDYGTEAARVELKGKKSISDKITAFFYSFYDFGIDARGYESNTQKMVVSNNELNTLNSESILKLDSYDYFCKEGDYQFINDSILEVKFNSPQYEYDNQKYAFETRYEYYQVNKAGFIKKLSSNRYYDFTKFIKIQNYHLEGCFAWELTDPEYMQDYNMWVADHLSIEDLDIMRNEIFAEYGYKFKTKEWQDFFSTKAWYKPLYDDVNDQLTEIDKANVQFILSIKEEMLKDEAKYRSQKPENYVAAG